MKYICFCVSINYEFLYSVHIVFPLIPPIFVSFSEVHKTWHQSTQILCLDDAKYISCFLPLFPFFLCTEW